MMLILACVCLVAFTLNVSVGSITGTAFLGNVSEMLLLLAFAICFSVAVLQREAKARTIND
ncbi:MAG: hypothetical protein Rhims3KO_27240 [Hyphomicrobiales bacterium]